MSNQNGTDCCAPLACEPLSDAGAEDLAPLFKAVADPVRLRLLSLIACHEGGESCVCDLTDAFDVTGRRSAITCGSCGRRG